MKPKLRSLMTAGRHRCDDEVAGISELSPYASHAIAGVSSSAETTPVKDEVALISPPGRDDSGSGDGDDDDYDDVDYNGGEDDDDLHNVEDCIDDDEEDGHIDDGDDNEDGDEHCNRLFRWPHTDMLADLDALHDSASMAAFSLSTPTKEDLGDFRGAFGHSEDSDS